MTDYPEIFVLRHGQTEWNRAGRHQGRLNSDLTGLGREQAQTQGQILSRVLGGRGDVGALCSPQGRAQETATIALAEIDQTATCDDRLCEIGFGKWEGLTFDAIAAQWPDLSKNADVDPFGFHFRAPGGEAFETLRARAQDLLGALTGPTILVTHGITSRVLRALWLGGDPLQTAAELPGGQGCVYHLKDGAHHVLQAG